MQIAESTSRWSHHPRVIHGPWSDHFGVHKGISISSTLTIWARWDVKQFNNLCFWMSHKYFKDTKSDANKQDLKLSFVWPVKHSQPPPKMYMPNFKLISPPKWDLNQGIFHLRSKFGGPILNGWWVIAWTNSNGVKFDFEVEFCQNWLRVKSTWFMRPWLQKMSLTYNRSVDANCESFIDTLNRLLDQCFLFKTVSRTRSKEKPCITAEMQKVLNTKIDCNNMMLVVAQKTKSVYDVQTRLGQMLKECWERLL